MMKTQKTILDILVDKYEKSKTHLGNNKTHQNFDISISKVFPDYTENCDYNFFVSINNALLDLDGKKYISIEYGHGEYMKKAKLIQENLDKIYTFLNRKPKLDIYDDAKKIINQFFGFNNILDNYCNELLLQISLNKGMNSILPNGDTTKLHNVLLALKEIPLVEHEIPYREFSVKIYSDSKIFADSIKSTVEKILCKYGDYKDKKTVLAHYNIVPNPTHVHVKGGGSVLSGNKQFDISCFDQGIAFPYNSLVNISSIKIQCKRVVTVENLTTFYSYPANDDFVIYLGGYHNTTRGQFLKKIFKNNPTKEYYHFGDIDAGGFNILENLINRTGIPFKPLLMNKNILLKYKEYCKPLEGDDKSRLLKLNKSIYADTINFMIENECKLEQEAISIKEELLEFFQDNYD